MIKYYRALLLVLIAAVGIMSWYFGLFYKSSVLYIADQYVPLGIYISWTFLIGSIALLMDVLTTTVHKIHKYMCPFRAITLFTLSVAWAGHIMISPNKLLIIIPCSIASLCCLGLAVADGVRKNKRMIGELCD